ncbi:hypothetical protein BC834DRAFT_820691 [Gloeopeniophorella convolvens]|nr:hypothetical protein BC834DRAFT_820691 [Gloeopeniophorella convolvens]
MRAAFILLGLSRLAQSAQVYFHPPISTPESLSHSLASAVVAKHLQLERFELLQENGQVSTNQLPQPFVGQGTRSSLLLGIDEADADYIIPVDGFESSFSLSDPNPSSTFSNILRASLQRAHHAFSHVFDASKGTKDAYTPLLDMMNVSPATETFVSELSALVDFLESDDLSWDRFGAFQVTGLRAIADAYGRQSEQYEQAAAALGAALRSALTKAHLNLVLFTHPGAPAVGLARRQDQSPLPPHVPLPPIGSDTLCFASQDACANSTSECSGHGECVGAARAGRTCFVCACEATKNEMGGTEYWAGSKCERKDVSGPFVLIAGTVITLILIIGGSIALLSSVGSQPLPSVLTSSVPGGSVRE